MWKAKASNYIHNVSETSSVIAGGTSYVLWIILMIIFIPFTPVLMWIPMNRIERPKQ